LLLSGSKLNFGKKVIPNFSQGNFLKKLFQTRRCHAKLLYLKEKQFFRNFKDEKQIFWSS